MKHQHITLAGMSGIGKSTHARELGRKGFRVLGCDNQIIKYLQALHTAGDGVPKINNMNDLSRWLGHPYEESYGTNSQLYLELEEQAIVHFLENLGDDTPPTVIDTTGSLPYISPSLIKRLRKNTIIFVLDTPHSSVDEGAERTAIAEMLRRFKSDPKPIIWDGHFKKNGHESNMEALFDCYPNLLRDRARRYREIADFRLAYNIHSMRGFSTDDLMLYINAAVDCFTAKA